MMKMTKEAAATQTAITHIRMMRRSPTAAMKAKKNGMSGGRGRNEEEAADEEDSGTMLLVTGFEWYD